MTLATSLLEWYDAHKRTLPWRTDAPDPYAVWVSEIMLQQTTVAAATGFFLRWMEAFPTIESLAAAPLDDVLKLWAGLGYYARARNLHKGAQFVVQNLGGIVPRTVPELLTLPGVGRYTAGAISSIAFNENAPIVDANVMRVLCRAFLIGGDPRSNAPAQAALWNKAAELIPDGRAGDFNQALMELGALVCVPHGPKCEACPVQPQCAAFQTGQTDTFPQFLNVKLWARETHAAAAVFDRFGNFLLVQRPASSALWGGLWELPRALLREREELEACAARAVRENVGIGTGDFRPFGTLKHVVASRRITLHGFAGAYREGKPAAEGCAGFAWVKMDALKNYALPTPQARLLELLAAHLRQGQLDLD